MKKLATKLTPAIKAWIKEEFKSDFYESDGVDFLFHFPNYKNNEGFFLNWHINNIIQKGYTKVSESEFLAEFAKPKIDNTERVIQVRNYDNEEWEKRVVFMFKNNKAICWVDAENIEDSKDMNSAFGWNFWREMPETITKEEAEKLLAENGIHKTII